MESFNLESSLEIKKETRLNGLQAQFTVSGANVESQSTVWLWDIPLFENYNEKQITKCLQLVKNDLEFITNCSSHDLNVITNEELRLLKLTANCHMRDNAIKSR